MNEAVMLLREMAGRALSQGTVPTAGPGSVTRSPVCGSGSCGRDEGARCARGRGGRTLRHPPGRTTAARE